MVKRKEELDSESREQIVYPGRLLFLPDHTFRISKPAVIGVRILGGRIHIGQRLLKDGVVVGQIKSIRKGEETKKEAIQGDEVAIAIDGVTVGRQIDEQDVITRRRSRETRQTTCKNEFDRLGKGNSGGAVADPPSR